MPIKRGRVAKAAEVRDVIKEHQPFAADPTLTLDVLDIVLPSAHPDHRQYYGRKDRAYIRDTRTWRILVTAPSAYALVQKIRAGWKYQPDKKEGLWA